MLIIFITLLYIHLKRKGKCVNKTVDTKRRNDFYKHICCNCLSIFIHISFYLYEQTLASIFIIYSKDMPNDEQARPSCAKCYIWQSRNWQRNSQNYELHCHKYQLYWLKYHTKQYVYNIKLWMGYVYVRKHQQIRNICTKNKFLYNDLFWYFLTIMYNYWYIMQYLLKVDGFMV